jgi:uncharacterized protein (DUF2384 family)
MNAKLPIDLIEQGVNTFGNEDAFLKWLHEEKFFFDKRSPNTFINSDEGIKLIKDTLVAMSYGDNA